MVSLSLNQVLSEPDDPEGKELFDAFKFQQRELIRKKPDSIKKPKRKKLHLTSKRLIPKIQKRKRRDFR